MQDTRPALALSTWSIHRALGLSFPDTPADGRSGGSEPTWGAGTLSLMEVPERIAALGIGRLEVCSFHLPRGDRGYLRELRGALDGAGVALQALLIDDGDLADPLHGDRDAAWIGAWIDVAAELGAERARVIGGKQPPDPAVLQRVTNALARLARRGDGQGVRVTTENWHATLANPDAVHAVLDRLDGAVGLLADFGNWSGPGKYDDLASILPRAENCHAKCAFADDMTMDADDYGRCLAVAEAAGYRGPFTLIYEGTNDDEWAGIAMERDFILARAGSSEAALVH